MMKASMSSGLLLVLLLAAVPASAKELRTTIVYDDAATDLTAREDAGQLWITAADLKRATRFEVKPQGVCRDELCFPLPKAKREAFIHKDAGNANSMQAWFNMTAFADLVHQPVAHDAALSTWYFGLRSDQRQQLSSLQAPDFKLPDLQGKLHRLSDFHGKKILLVTWASW
jgi:hypothetical protein